MAACPQSNGNDGAPSDPHFMFTVEPPIGELEADHSELLAAALCSSRRLYRTTRYTRIAGPAAS